MKLTAKLSPLAVATTLAITSLAAPVASYAEISSSATLSSMYLWRGQNISDGAPALSGDITYKHSSGLYAFGWMSSEGVKNAGEGTGAVTTESYEVDFGVGYAGKIKEIGYDVGYYKFWYPESGEAFGAANAEIWVGLSFKDASFKALIDAKGASTYKYYTLGYGMGKFSGLIGITANDGANNDYKHFDLTYKATDRLSFTLSKPFSVDSGAGIDSDPLMVISYSLPIDIK